ncbi:RNA polymerase sigma factor sigC-like [Andrographis paniculata]|uniref:RNA polymerase sigma factor sigC-like n=1 Tax=Andrographis paniculata TaxID=175694 RepID=UPI0021E8877C|nr:RNA polymerase sigma factor sigC-like [Andrographis paniculata]
MGFRLHLKWPHSALPTSSPSSSSSSSSPSSSCPNSSYSCRGRESSRILGRLTAASLLYGEAETVNEIFRAQASSSAPQVLENYVLRSKETKVPIRKSSSDAHSSLHGSEIQTSSNNDDESECHTALRAINASHFRLLMKNLDVLEGICADSNTVRLERDILEQLDRLGALRFFHSCLSRTTNESFNPATELVDKSKESKENGDVEIVRSGKKELRRSRRRKTPLKLNRTALDDPALPPNSASARGSSKSKNTRHKIARNEAEMSRGVKMVAGLEKIKMAMERETGQSVTSLSSWAEAAGIENKELYQRLRYGWHCRDELLRSTRSLVLFIARNYGGFGVAFEDLIQAGYIGVLQGAERFDQSRGYKFSTYVQYWIRKSISTMVSKHARGIRIPSTLNKVVSQVQKARKALSTSHGKYPDDDEIAKHTGLSMAKITSASKCLRVVGSIDQNVWDGVAIKYMEITADRSVQTPEESVIQQHMIKDLYGLLDDLEAREKEVVVLRFGLGNRQCKSLEEIGRQFCVSKEWIRKIERTALTKLRDQKSLQILTHYALFRS